MSDVHVYKRPNIIRTTPWDVTNTQIPRGCYTPYKYTNGTLYLLFVSPKAKLIILKINKINAYTNFMFQARVSPTKRASPPDGGS